MQICFFLPFRIKRASLRILQAVGILMQTALPHSAQSKGEQAMIMDRIALILTIAGALNWGSIGLFQFDIVAWICGGSSSLLSRVIYTVIALAGIWCISLLFRSREEMDRIEE